MAFDSIVSSSTVIPDYIKIALLTNAPYFNNEPELDTEPKLPGPNLNFGNGKGKEKSKKEKLASAEEINERRKYGQATRGPKSKAQGYVKEKLSFEQFLEDRRECLKIAPFLRDPKNWFPTLPEKYKSIEEQLRAKKLAINKEDDERIAWEKCLAKTSSPLAKEWD